jgi:hypothetical protein
MVYAKNSGLKDAKLNEIIASELQVDLSILVKIDPHDKYAKRG